MITLRVSQSWAILLHEEILYMTGIGRRVRDWAKPWPGEGKCSEDVSAQKKSGLCNIIPNADPDGNNYLLK